MHSLILIHILCTLLSYAAFLVACVSSVLFLVQEREIKHKHMGSLFYALPSLERLDAINLWAIGAGFLLLSVGVVFGLVGSHVVLGVWWSGDPKTIMVLGLWAWYCVLWLVRLRSTLRGRRVALLSVLGFSFLLFTFIGARWLIASGHPYV